MKRGGIKGDKKRLLSKESGQEWTREEEKWRGEEGMGEQIGVKRKMGKGRCGRDEDKVKRGYRRG